MRLEHVFRGSAGGYARVEQGQAASAEQSLVGAKTADIIRAITIELRDRRRLRCPHTHPFHEQCPPSLPARSPATSFARAELHSAALLVSAKNLLHSHNGHCNRRKEIHPGHSRPP